MKVKKEKALVSEKQVQRAVNGIAREHKVPGIKVKFNINSPKSGGTACYETYHYRGQKTNHAVDIKIYGWDVIRRYPDEVIYAVAHELAHHIMNMRTNNLRHSKAFYKLTKEIEYKLSSRKLATVKRG